MFPKRKDRFVAWSRAMVEGATVDKPNYSAKKTGRTRPARRRRGSSARRKRNNAKKE